ncbi:hypothetical protein QO010_000912 [Caulobacter ginsengisoli]|uniref:DUF3089 domain-containing protein n=1 Tax=Caulobacter ginsengisoli TaxID=400775 RepID=A0ABU0IMC4_9CAUL|nr:DUF3089 domain-containing protein [Caulobacter ginsengisoli]MDQ0463164.1 hypothetical protein [Caulobacter ginsengisoli]
MANTPPDTTTPDTGPLRGARLWFYIAGTVTLLMLVVAAIVFRVDILRTSLDPKVPFQAYRPPRAPNYAEAKAWALLPARPAQPSAEDPPADVFFIHPTTYDGGEHWNAPFRDGKSSRLLERVMLPNYAGPFVRVGRIFAPRYRQASLYSQLTLREDARQARAFAYGDVLAAFRYWLAHDGGERPFVIVGVEQGGLLAARLLRDEVATDPRLRARFAGAYLIETVVPAASYAPGVAIPACLSRQQTGCVLAWNSLRDGDIDAPDRLSRSLVWTPTNELETLDDSPALCVNPLTGGQGGEHSQPREALGAVNATGLEWGVRPPLLKREVTAWCKDGILRVTRPKSTVFKRSGGWADRLKVAPYNLFYADIEADALARIAVLQGRGSKAMLPAPRQ